MSLETMRNFCIIAHIDHGKSTLADRFLEYTHTVDARKVRAQYLDQMDIERERGITIKLAPVTMRFEKNGVPYALHLIDTPGHVDFSYEVSRSLASVEGALLLVDATQGIEAQTLTTLYLAMEQDLTIIPVINKIDLPSAQIDVVEKDLARLLGVATKDILRVSAKTGQGVEELLSAVIDRIPPPKSQEKETRALVFDSMYDDYKGVIAYVRMFGGSIRPKDTIRMLQTKCDSEVLEVGKFYPHQVPVTELSSGEIGYVVTGLKDVRDLAVGDTMTFTSTPHVTPLEGYKKLQPVVFAGIYAKEGNEFAALREALERLTLNDASLSYEPDRSPALGFGFRCGFLGLLHLEVVTERLKREYDLNLIVTVPSVAYQVYLNEAGKNAYERKKKQSATKDPFIRITSALDLPEVSHIDRIEEPWVAMDIVTPSTYIGNCMDLVSKSHGVFLQNEYLDEERVIIHVELPLASILVDFYDKLKSVTQGYASYHYDIIGYRSADVVRLEILVAEEKVDALSTIVYASEADSAGRSITERLKETLPQQLFEVKIQAAVGAKIVASSRIRPLRKDVTEKLYGGDVTRKRKLLEKQKKGKKRMRASGRVDIPHESFLAVLKRK